jgi:branched-chain amino acid transport system ATP-binding protein
LVIGKFGNDVTWEIAVLPQLSPFPISIFVEQGIGNEETGKMSLLEIVNVSISFDGLLAVSDVSFNVEAGEIFALIGPNGAGKTTLLNCINRIVKQSNGSIYFTGQDISKLKRHQVVNLGVARTFQNIELFFNMTVLENILLGYHHLLSTGILSASFFSKKARQGEVEARILVEEIIDFLGLQGVRDRFVFQLSFGYQKRIELGRALAMQPKLLLLDEPASGMNVEETEELAWWIMEIQRQLGITVFLVEHDMRLVMDISHRIGVLDQGNLIALGEPKEIQENPDVRQAYLGEGKEKKDAFG